MKSALEAIAHMKVDEKTNALDLLTLCKTIARIALEENQRGYSAHEPRGCPTPGACSCE